MAEAASPTSASQTTHAPRIHPLTAHRARALAEGILTEKGARDGYVVYRPCRTMASCWSADMALNAALTVLETRAVQRTLSDPTFPTHLHGLTRYLDAHIQASRRLARLVQRLARQQLTTADRALLDSSTPVTTSPQLAALLAWPPNTTEEDADVLSDILGTELEELDAVAEMIPREATT